MSTYLLPALFGLVLLLAAALLAGVAWERRGSRASEASLAWRDPLSGLYCKALWLELLGSQLALAARLHHPVAVLVVECDEAYSPALLRSLAQRLAARVRDHDLLGQADAGRFLIALPDSDVGAALVLAQDLCDGQAGRAREPRAAHPIISVSVGVHAHQPVPLDDTTELALAMTAAAQRALDATRADGPGRVEIEP